MLDNILSQIQKPARYIGEEWNVCKKDFERAYIRFALCFPDLYELGMSNLGIRIIYGLLNSIGDVCGERFFSPALDMEEILRKEGRGIFSLESRRTLSEFDIIGFSLSYELSYTNVLNMLDLGGIPFRASARDYHYPLVAAGGPAVINPEPMADFFDIFVIGEAEELIVQFIDVYRGLKEEYKANRISKRDLLLEFAKIEGVYVPGLYEVRYSLSGEIEEFKPNVPGLGHKIKKRIVQNLDNTYFPVPWIVPFIQIVHDRITLEIMRGCPNRCRFCQARQIYFPFRKRSQENILKLADQTFKSSGYEEISLAGLSVSDYPALEKLVALLINTFTERCVHISLPSIRPKEMLSNLSSLIASSKKTSLTFAPEAATERLRNILGKDFDVSSLLETVRQLQPLGYQHIKLYFMIGLPSETEADLDAIVDFCVSLCRSIQLNVSINTLIPKPHTAFERLAMEQLDRISSKQSYLKQRFSRYKRIRLNFHPPHLSYLEAILSRGDRRLGEVILNVFKQGAKFDAWDEHFSFEKWQTAFKQSNIDPEFYLKERPQTGLLPWDFIDIGMEEKN